jgi:hypothetical protein
VSGDIAPRILNLGTRWRWEVTFTSHPLHPRCNSSRYPMDRRLGGLQSRSGCSGEEKKSHHYPSRELTPGRPPSNLEDRGSIPARNNNGVSFVHYWNVTRTMEWWTRKLHKLMGSTWEVMLRWDMKDKFQCELHIKWVSYWTNMGWNRFKRQRLLQTSNTKFLRTTLTTSDKGTGRQTDTTSP